MSTTMVLYLSAATALAGCASRAVAPRPVDAGYQGYVNTARNAFKQGNLQQASTFYDRSLMRARTIDHPAAIADAAYNLSICLMALGELERAAALLDEAEAELTRDKSSFAHVLIAQSQLARRRQDYDAVGTITDRLLSRSAAETSGIQRFQAFVIRSHVACDRQRLAQASAELQSAKAIAGSLNDDALLAEAAGLEARIESLSGRPATAAEYYLKQAALLQRARLYFEMSTAQEQAGQSFKRAGQHGNAATLFFRSARSFLGQGQHERAAKILTDAATSANADGNAEWLHRIEALQVELKALRQNQPSPSGTPER
ncbi:MAG: hypothetical protein WD768_15525 [Phycisphaeraceae bacterium]